MTRPPVGVEKRLRRLAGDARELFSGLVLDVNYSCAAATIRTVHSPLCPSSSWPAGCGKREAFSKGCGRVPGGRVGVAAFHTPADRRPG